MGKKLWTEGDAGQPITLYAAFNEQDEARFVIEQIEQWIEQIEQWLAKGRRAEEVAIVYRTTAQSRLFEEYLLRASIAYRVYGGQRFFERAEIRDGLAYLRDAFYLAPAGTGKQPAIVASRTGVHTAKHTAAQGNDGCAGICSADRGYA